MPALSAGMKSFAVRAARALNRCLLGRRGAIWGDRYHRRELSSPVSVRRALVYIINNHLKHGEHEAGLVDECSSAPWFAGWMQRVEPPPEPTPVESPTTWLLERGWHDDIHFLHLGELPKGRAVSAMTEHFDIQRPTSATALPVVVHVPHGSNRVPAAHRASELLAMTDHYTGEPMAAAAKR